MQPMTTGNHHLVTSHPPLCIATTSEWHPTHPCINSPLCLLVLLQTALKLQGPGKVSNLAGPGEIRVNLEASK